MAEKLLFKDGSIVIVREPCAQLDNEKGLTTR